MSDRVVVIVGGSLGGLRTAEQVRSAGHTGPLRVIGEEVHLPYNRPPLSKEVLADPGDDDVDRLHATLAFRRRASVADVEFLLGSAAVGADLTARTVRLDDGTTLPYDGLVVATGLRARRLDLPGPHAGRHVVRTLDDALGLRAAIAARPAVVVIGSGFVGCETAASLHALGLAVTVVDPAEVPFARALGPRLGAAIRRHLERAGVTFAMGVGVAGYTGDATVTGVTLADGRILDAGLVVEAVGSRCNTEWLDGNGLDLSDGVLTDNNLAVAGAERVVAVGDIARFPNPLVDDVPRRVEHWSMPTDTAKRAGATLVAQLTDEPAPGTPFTPIPSFWSDLLDLRIQAFGSPALADEAILEEGDLDRLADGALMTYRRSGLLIGTVAVNLPPARQRQLRERFLERVS